MARRPRDPLRYSRFVRVVKFVLPILALMVLSTVFLVQRDDSFEGRLIFSDVDRKSLDDGLTIHNPQITGITDAGGGYRISADTAVPDGPRPTKIRFTSLTARTSQPSGREIELTGKQGHVVIASSVVVVEGDVVLETSDGYRMQTERAEANFTSGSLHTVAVVVDGPLGTIDAGRLQIDERPQPDDPDATKEFFFFDKGVKLVHRPEGNSE